MNTTSLTALRTIASAGAVVTTVLAPSLVLAAPAGAAGLRILSPAPQTLLTGGRPIDLSYAGLPRGATLAVTVDSRRRLTRRGAPARGRKTLSTAGLAPGEHAVHVEALRNRRVLGTTMRRVVIGRRTPGLLRPLGAAAARRTLARDPAAGAAGARSAYVPRTGAVVAGVRTRGVTAVTFTLNGRRVAERFEHSGPRTHALLLSPDDGLRFGRNVLVARGFRAKDGAWATLSQTIVRSHREPLAAAGPDRRVVPRTRIRLDGRRSLPDRRGDGLRYRWRIVGGPAGGATLTRAGNARPSLAIRKPGIYRVALRVQETPRHGRAMASAAAVTAEDVTTITAAPAVPAIGMPLTVTVSGGAASIDYTIPATMAGATGSEQGAAAPGGQSCPASSFCVVRFDRSSLAMTGYTTEADSTAAASAASGAVTAGAGSSTFKSYVAAGGADAPADGQITVQTAPSKGWTAVWVGTSLAAVNRTSWLNGGIEGTLMRDISEGETFFAEPSGARYTFREQDWIPFVTRVETSPSATTSTFRVGATSYPTTIPSGASGGFAALVLDPATGKPIAGTPKAFATSTGNNTNDQSSLSALGSLIDSAKSADDVVLLQSFGTPRWQTFGNGNNRQTWDLSAIDRFGELGSSDDILDALSSTTDSRGGSYALAGVPGESPTQAGMLEASVSVGTGGSLNGVLARDGQSRLRPVAADKIAPDNSGLGTGRWDVPGTAFAPATPWPAVRADDGGTGAQAAFDALATWLTGLGATGGVESCPDAPDAIRATYCGGSTAVQAIQNDLTEFSLPSGASYTQADLDDAKDQITREINEVEAVDGWVGDLGTVLSNAGLTSPDIANSIVARFSSSLTGSAGQTNASNGLNAFGGLAGLGAAMLDGPEAFPLVVASSALWTLSTLSGGTNSDNEALLNSIEVNASNAAASLTNSFAGATAYLDQIADLLVSDPAKLAAASTAIKGSATDPGWAVTDPSKPSAAAQAQVAQWLWGAVLSANYDVFYGSTNFNSNPYCWIDQGGPNWSGDMRPFSNADSTTRFANEPLAGLTWWLGKSSGPFENAISPPNLASLWAPVTGSGDITTAGAVPSWFLHNGLFNWQALPGKSTTGCAAGK